MIGWLILAAAAVGLFALGLAVGRSRPTTSPTDIEESGELAPERVPLSASGAPSALNSPLPEPPPSARAAAPRAVDIAVDRTAGKAVGGPSLIAVVIDDLGRGLAPLEQLAALGIPVSYAVLPFETETPAVVEWLRRGGHEILVHLPMQAQGTADPGPGALYTNLDAGSLRQRTKRALDAVPGAVGVNNHMGSAFTIDPAKMKPVLREIAKRKMFFLDSRTSGRSVAFDMALELGIPSARRSVFLDNQPQVGATSRQFDEVLALARANGSAIAIGHPYPSTLETLALRVPEALAAGFQFVPVSFLLERSSVPGD